MNKAYYNSPYGKIVLASNDNSLIYLGFDDICAIEKQDEVLTKTIKWLDKYFNKEKPIIDFSLNPKGTKFQQIVWKKLNNIPYGETKTYGQIAKEIDKNMSAQAVGTACGANPIAVIIPCHRVIGANGKLGGYGYGLEMKKGLLDLENGK